MWKRKIVQQHSWAKFYNTYSWGKNAINQIGKLEIQRKDRESGIYLNLNEI